MAGHTLNLYGPGWIEVRVRAVRQGEQLQRQRWQRRFVWSSTRLTSVGPPRLAVAEARVISEMPLDGVHHHSLGHVVGGDVGF
jgi:hypothetical protein